MAEAVFRRAKSPPRRDVVIHYRTYKEEIRRRARRTPGPGYVRGALARVEATLGRPAEVALVSDDPALALRTLGDVGREITVAFACPTGLANNSASGAPLRTRSGEGAWGAPGEIVRRGHPFYVTFTL